MYELPDTEFDDAKVHDGLGKALYGEAFKEIPTFQLVIVICI